MDASTIVSRCQQFQAVLLPEGNCLRVSAPAPLPNDLIQALREHKTEILAHLSKPKLVEGSPQWHADQIAEAVRKEGICIFWSDLFGELIAFVKDASFKKKVLAGLVTYDDHELRELFGQGKLGLSATNLKLIHEAKKAGGGHIVSHESKG